ncbi:hypothetical protein OIE66_39730 [Nonomuraea sp. NBC_01738]|uniref:hypothetical protein n=1 Tax=Nonomuraea sp. NBC_01738 TaxID=2976003 RepID=UPI002E153192|nr:hypothetical protein OIE66_39730 [Nonomuraea sp. NBC_01738]
MRYAWMCHPATALAVLVLLVNDHLLKQTWPGPLTGKLSDVAGLVVAPPLVALLFLRRADLAATVLTGVLFTLVKTTEPGAETASQLWSLVAGPSRVLADPTDLLALPALALTWWIRQKSLRSDLRHWRVLVVVPLAVLAVGATSAAPGPPEADVVRVQGQDIVVTGRWMGGHSSRDGGVTWTAWNGDPLTPGPTAECVPNEPRRCYRLAPGELKVMQSDDAGATWTTAWELPPGRLDLLMRTHEVDTLRSLSLAVQERPRGHVVVVANGRDGVLVRDPGGAWDRLGLDPDGTPSLAATVPYTGAGADIGREIFVALVAGFLVIVLGLTVAAGAYRPGTSRLIIALLAVFGAVLLGQTPWADVVGYPLTLGATALGGLLLVGMFAAAWVEAAGMRVGRPAVWHVLTTAVLVALAVVAPFRAWTSGWPDLYGQAVMIAAGVALFVAAGGLVLVRRNARLRSAERRYLAGSSTSSPT